MAHYLVRSMNVSELYALKEGQICCTEGFICSSGDARWVNYCDPHANRNHPGSVPIYAAPQTSFDLTTPNRYRITGSWDGTGIRAQEFTLASNQTQHLTADFDQLITRRREFPILRKLQQPAPMFPHDLIVQAGGQKCVFNDGEIYLFYSILRYWTEPAIQTAADHPHHGVAVLVGHPNDSFPVDFNHYGAPE